jgi:hypothetical protein
MSKTKMMRFAVLFAGIAATPIAAMCLPIINPPSSDYAVAWHFSTDPEEPPTVDCELGGNEDCPE